MLNPGKIKLEAWVLKLLVFSINPGPIFLVPSLQEGGSKEMYKNDINKCYVYL